MDAAKLAPIALLLAAAVSCSSEDGEGDTGRSAAEHARVAAQQAETLFTRDCARCHGAAPVPRAPDREALAAKRPETILAALSFGIMTPHASQLSSAEQRLLSAHLSSTDWGAAPDLRAALCETPATLGAEALTGPRWLGWSNDLFNRRFQPADQAGLDAASLQQLELRWAFAFPETEVVVAQPVVVGGWLFVGSAAGGVYALDAGTGCLRWRASTRSGVRSAVAIGVTAGRLSLYLGDMAGWVYAFDAETGKRLWEVRPEPHPATRITGAPVVYGERLVVPVSSFEEWSASTPAYECCSFRGSVVALDRATGETLWQHYTIKRVAETTGENELGVRRLGPSGAAIWSAPTLDPEWGTLYVGTGDSYSDPPAETSDAILALELETGDRLWVRQTTRGDAFTMGCADGFDPRACPDSAGPDHDYGASPALHVSAGGEKMLIAGQKSGVLYALDPVDGKVLWERRLSEGGISGGIEWGFASDGEAAYVPISDLWENRETPEQAGGLAAVQLSDGALLWHKPAPVLACRGTAGCSAAQMAAATAIPGVVFSGSMDGHLRAFDTRDGRILWDVDTTAPVATTAGGSAHGGSINGGGVAVVDGWVFAGSGYGLGGLGMPGNVLLGFGPPAAE